MRIIASMLAALVLVTASARDTNRYDRVETRGGIEFSQRGGLGTSNEVVTAVSVKDFVPTFTNESAKAAFSNAVGAVESDPTVPSWAKNPDPPVTEETDPTVPDWAKKPSPPVPSAISDESYSISADGSVYRLEIVDYPERGGRLKIKSLTTRGYYVPDLSPDAGQEFTYPDYDNDGFMCISNSPAGMDWEMHTYKEGGYEQFYFVVKRHNQPDSYVVYRNQFGQSMSADGWPAFTRELWFGTTSSRSDYVAVFERGVEPAHSETNWVRVGSVALDSIYDRTLGVSWTNRVDDGRVYLERAAQ